ncbi:MAG: metallophosphoesterase [Candidatus Poribacteria bacterium]|nr:metallophosphoesterase [Candidatus Poribacteria bacterium]
MISDLHTDVTPLNKQILPYIVQAAEKAELNIFILAGDLSPNLLELAKILTVFTESNLNCPKLFVPGNHDIWVIEHPSVTSEKKSQAIAEICRACNFHALGTAPFVLNGIGFCGTIGWYDYSFGRKKYNISEEKYASKQMLGSVWNDLHYAKWSGTDREVAHRFEADLRRQIDSIKDSVSQIIVTTHHVPFQESVHYRGRLPWDFFSAFMGSRGLGEICLKEPLITHALFGHTHMPIRQQLGDVTAICSPVGYLREPPAQGLPSYAAERLTCLEI